MVSIYHPLGFNWHPLEGVLDYINVQNGPKFYLNHFVNVQEIHDPQIPFVFCEIAFTSCFMRSSWLLQSSWSFFSDVKSFWAAGGSELQDWFTWPNLHWIGQMLFIDVSTDWFIHSVIHSFIQSVIHSCVDELPFSFIICPNHINAHKWAVNLGGCRLKGDVTNC